MPKCALAFQPRTIGTLVKLVALVAVGLIAVPASALALNSTPAQPTTVSISATNSLPTCTALPFHLVNSGKVPTIVIRNVDTGRVRLSGIQDGRPLAAGTYTYTWCPGAKMLGSDAWRVYTGYRAQ